MRNEKDRVLQPGFHNSQNWFASDLILQHWVESRFDEDRRKALLPKLKRMGKNAATKLANYALKADSVGPKLEKRDKYGETINEIRFDDAYWKMLRIAVESDMLRLKWEPSLREFYQQIRHQAGFALGFLFAMAENGLYCPLCMTDGAAMLIDKYCKTYTKKRLLERIYTEDWRNFFTGAMFLTERSGGSDVGQNVLKTYKIDETSYLLDGDKWFCSNANADVIFALARTEPDTPGTKGLGLFLIEKNNSWGGKQKGLDHVRLKEKVGVRSMATSECHLDCVNATLIGGLTDGFKIMTEMINLSRLYNSVAALANMRRGLNEAWEYLSYRNLFDVNALTQPLIREKFHELYAHYVGQFYFTWKVISLQDAADNGETDAQELIRFLIPMLKKETGEMSVYIVREAMELIGGNAFIEDGGFPRIMRDALVAPIWEGAGNIMTLDMMRAAVKSKGLNLLLSYLTKSLSQHKPELIPLVAELSELLKSIPLLEKDERETTASALFKKLCQLAQIAFMFEFRDETSAEWIDIASARLTQNLTENGLRIHKCIPLTELKKLVAWRF